MFEKQPDAQLTTLTNQLTELITINKALLKKLEGLEVKINTIGAFVKTNSADMPSFGVGR